MNARDIAQQVIEDAYDAAEKDRLTAELNECHCAEGCCNRCLDNARRLALLQGDRYKAAQYLNM